MSNISLVFLFISHLLTPIIYSGKILIGLNVKGEDIMTNIRKITQTAVAVALVCIATMISIPVAPTGYINLGDALTLFFGCLLGPVYGAIAAGVGSALADIILSYVYYAPATLVIKAVMAVVAGIFFKYGKNKLGIKTISGFVISEIIMIFGYYLYYAIISKNFIAALSTVWGNACQALAGIVLACLLIKISKRIK